MKKELRVVYDGPINSAMDRLIEWAVGFFGYRRWASGINVEDGKRDLAFDLDEDLGEGEAQDG